MLAKTLMRALYAAASASNAVSQQVVGEGAGASSGVCYAVWTSLAASIAAVQRPGRRVLSLTFMLLCLLCNPALHCAAPPHAGHRGGALDGGGRRQHQPGGRVPLAAHWWGWAAAAPGCCTALECCPCPARILTLSACHPAPPASRPPCPPHTDSRVDGLFKAFAISLPENSELLDRIPEADPTLLHEVRCGAEGPCGAEGCVGLRGGLKGQADGWAAEGWGGGLLRVCLCEHGSQ